MSNVNIVSDLLEEIKGLREDLAKLSNELKKVYRENSKLKSDLKYYKEKCEELQNTLKRYNIEVKLDLKEVLKTYDRLKKKIIEAILDLTQRDARPPHYNDIARYITNRCPYYSIETINRTLRKMKEEGLLFSPSKGRYYLNVDKVKEETNSGIINYLGGDLDG